jgi:hypothetical protein
MVLQVLWCKRQPLYYSFFCQKVEEMTRHYTNMFTDISVDVVRIPTEWSAWRDIINAKPQAGWESDIESIDNQSDWFLVKQGCPWRRIITRWP